MNLTRRTNRKTATKINPLELRIIKLEKQILAIQLVLRDITERLEFCMDELLATDDNGDDLI